MKKSMRLVLLAALVLTILAFSAYSVFAAPGFDLNNLLGRAFVDEVSSNERDEIPAETEAEPEVADHEQVIAVDDEDAGQIHHMDDPDVDDIDKVEIDDVDDDVQNGEHESGDPDENHDEGEEDCDEVEDEHEGDEG